MVLRKLLVCIPLLWGFVAPQAQAASVAEWRRDIDEIVKQVRIVHPDPFTKTGELVFLRAAQDFKDEMASLSEEQRVARAMRLMTLIGDAHSVIEPNSPDLAWWYPVRIVEFSDGYFITSAHNTVSELAGSQVLEVGGRPVKEAAEAARDLMSSDNRFWRKESLYPIHNAALMRAVGYARQDLTLRLRLKLANGRVVERTLTPQKPSGSFEFSHSSFDWRFGRTEVAGPLIAPGADWISAYKGLPASAYRTLDRNRPPHLAQRSLFGLPLPERDAYYVMINVWHGTQDESIPVFFQRVMREVDAQKPRRLILDLRYAPGGDGSNGPPVIQELIARKNNQPWKELYVLVSGRTYSASLNFLAPLVRNVPLTLVGEPMGGSWNLYGDYSTFQLPKTRLELRVSALRHELGESSDLRAFIPVDVPAVMSFSDYVAGRDPAVDPILAGQEMRSIPLVALAEGGAAARRVYQDRRRRFGDSELWAPPSEPELRKSGQQLVRDGRMADAVETFRLGAEIHPGEWRSWFNLGNAQRQAGDLQGAIDSYRRCLALNDPTNFNQTYLAGLVAQLEQQAKTQ